MSESYQILLPGLSGQLKFLTSHIKLPGLNTLIAGTSSEKAAKIISEKSGLPAELIVDDYESLLTSKLALGNAETVNVKMMSYEATDYGAASFDLIYAQASVSSVNRNKIIKEFKRILKPGGFLCVGELVKLSAGVPRFVQDIFDNSELLPLHAAEIEDYYLSRNFEIVAKKDLSSTLKNYYSVNSEKLKKTEADLNEDEKKYYKKLLNKISHETGAFLKLGADKHIGFTALLLKRN